MSARSQITVAMVAAIALLICGFGVCAAPPVMAAGKASHPCCPKEPAKNTDSSAQCCLANLIPGAKVELVMPAGASLAGQVSSSAVLVVPPFAPSMRVSAPRFGSAQGDRFVLFHQFLI